MQVLHSEVQTQPGDLIQVSFRSGGANIRLLNESEFQRFCDGHTFAPRYYETSPVYLRPTSGGRWFVVVDFAGYAGSMTAPEIFRWEWIRLSLQARGRFAPPVSPSDPSRCYYTGEPIQRADEIEISYPELHGIPHRGIIHSIQTGPMGTTVTVIHNSKRWGGVCIVSFADFEQGKLGNLRRRAESPQHADTIIARAESAIQHPYHWRMANCEQFTDWCYTGEPGESESLKAGGLVAAGLLGVALLWSSNSE